MMGAFLFFFIQAVFCHKLVQIRISDESAKIIRTELRSFPGFPHSTVTHSDHVKSPGSFNVYYHLNGKTVHSHSFADPQLLRGDWLSETGQLTGNVTRLPVGYQTITVPARAKHLTIIRTGHEDNMELRHVLQIPEANYVSSKFRTLNSVTGTVGVPQLTKFQVGHPAEQKNLVFLSGGYTSGEQSKFNDHVRRCMDFLKGSLSGTLDPAPWNRYFPVMNVYSVFQSSEEAGASYPKGVDGSGGKPPTNQEILRKNNLNCEYGTAMLRLLNCEVALVQSLASYAPVPSEKTTIIVLVNDETYGGSGGQRIGTVYSGPQMLTTLIHEIGHADADLSDEYDYALFEKKKLSLKNCHYVANPTPWDHWRGANNVHPGLGVGNPVAVCSYSNYYKASADQCLMSKASSQSYCAVCAEQVIRSIYSELSNLATPRCPREHEVLYIPSNSYAKLYVNQQFFRRVNHRLNAVRKDEGTIDATWTFLSRPQTAAVVCPISNLTCSVHIDAQTFGIGDHVVNLTVRDKSWFVNPDGSLPRMTYVTSFRFKVVNTAQPQYAKYLNCRPEVLNSPSLNTLPSDVNTCADSITSADPNGAGPYRYKFYCGKCDVGKICNDTYNAVPTEVKANVAGTVSKVESYLFGVGGALILGGIAIFIVGWFLLAHITSRGAHEIVPYPTSIKYARWGMMIFTVLVMFLSVGLILACIWAYMANDSSSFQRAIFLAAIVLASVLYILSYIGFTATYFRNQWMLAINGVLLTILIIILMVFGGMWLYVAANIRTKEMQDKMTNYWVDNLIPDHPKSICSLQGKLKCSGYTASCHNKFHSQCPINCEVTNRDNPNPCVNMFIYEQERVFKPVGITCIVLTVVLYLALFATWALCCFLRRHSQRLDRRLQAKPLVVDDNDDPRLRDTALFSIMKNLSDTERRDLVHEFERTDKGKTGKVNAAELQRFMRKTTGQKLSVSQCRECISAMDTQGDGRTNFAQLVNHSTTAAARKRKMKMLDELRLTNVNRRDAEELYDDFEKYDPDGDGTIHMNDVKVHYRRLYGVDPDSNDLAMALHALDHDGKSDRVTFYQFLHMFAAAKKHAHESPQKPV